MRPCGAALGWAGGEAEGQAERICAGAGEERRAECAAGDILDPAQVGECLCPLGALLGQPRGDRGHRGRKGGRAARRDLGM